MSQTKEEMDLKLSLNDMQTVYLRQVGHLSDVRRILAVPKLAIIQLY